MAADTNLPPTGSSAAQIDHNINEVWTAVRRQGESIAEIRQGLTAIADGLSDFKGELRSIRDIATRPQTPTNWLGVASLCVAILIAGGSYATSAISPVKQEAQEAKKWITARSEAMIDESRIFGQVVERSQHNDQMTLLNDQRLDEASERIARIEGLVESQSDWLKEVDRSGSRRWNRLPQGPE